MSEPQIPDPVAQTNDPVAQTNDPAAELPKDPLLGSDSVVDGDRPEPEAVSPENKQQAPNAGFEPGVVIAAEPISMLRPGEDEVEVTPRTAPRRRNPDEMAKRPTWLPEDWRIDLRVRSSGATAGLIDRYFIEPTGQRRFRSKIEVEHFLETGSKIKRKSTSEANDAPSESPLSSPKKTSKKGKKAKAVANGDGAETIK